jgi:outer membrane protein TolC
LHALSKSVSLRLALWAVVASPVVAHAQIVQRSHLVQPDAAGPAEVMTLEQALRYAAEHYPSVRAAVEQVLASTAGVDVAQAAYLPRLDILWQSNRATANNIFGQVFPQSVIPAMSGPVLPGTSSSAVWGSATGTLLTWDAYDFGLRRASVAGAEAALARARAGEALTRLEVQQAVASAFLTVVSAQQSVVAARADLERRDTLARAVKVLVDNQLRPGAEASRVDAERAAARTRVIQAGRTAALADATLARALGRTRPVTVDTAGLLDRVPTSAAGDAPASAHPLAQSRQASVEAARVQQQTLAHTDLPHVYLQGSFFARGSGAHATGELDGSAAGLGLDRANWGAGIQIVFPNVFDLPALHARQAAAAATERAESALFDEATLTIAEERAAARAMVDAASAVAENTPIQLAAARLGESQALARYQSGLANVVEVAEAQNLLAQAEFQDHLARVDVWRALLAQAVAEGDLAAFVRALRP